MFFFFFRVIKLTASWSEMVHHSQLAVNKHGTNMLRHVEKQHVLSWNGEKEDKTQMTRKNKNKTQHLFVQLIRKEHRRKKSLPLFSVNISVGQNRLKSFFFSCLKLARRSDIHTAVCTLARGLAWGVGCVKTAFPTAQTTNASVLSSASLNAAAEASHRNPDAASSPEPRWKIWRGCRKTSDSDGFNNL